MQLSLLQYRTYSAAPAFGVAFAAKKTSAVQQLEHVLGTLQHDPSHCVHRHIARAARQVSARFDEALAPCGLTAGQFTILMAVARMGALPIGRLAEHLGMDSTTVPRVMRPLLERGWVRLAAGEDRRLRMAAPTEAGIQRLIEALPVWERTQGEALATLGAARWTELRHGIAALRQGLRRTLARGAASAGARV